MDGSSQFHLCGSLHSAEDSGQIWLLLQTIWVLDAAVDIYPCVGYTCLDLHVVGPVSHTLQYKTGSNEPGSSLVLGSIPKCVHLPVKAPQSEWSRDWAIACAESFLGSTYVFLCMLLCSTCLPDCALPQSCNIMVRLEQKLASMQGIFHSPPIGGSWPYIGDYEVRAGRCWLHLTSLLAYCILDRGFHPRSGQPVIEND